MGNKQGKTRKNKGEAVALKEAEDDNAVENGDAGGRKLEGVPFEKYVFPFENLVFEGGGNKGLAYCGAVRVLEEVGIWKQIKRLAGTSSGAMTAALLAVGYNSRDLEGFMSQDLNKIFVDHSCGYCSLLPNIKKRFGWNPGKKLFAWFGARLKAATGNADVTFNEVYEKFGKEVCVVVTNVNQMNTEYCHTKTTPTMPIRLAVRMSMAMPGMFEAVPYKRETYTDYYVDGGVLCNYPIHCFDGWWLSMDPEDSFVHRLHPLTELPRLYEKKERFGLFNHRTMGFLLYNETEPEILQTSLERREGKLTPEAPPETKLAKKRVEKIEARKEAAKHHDTVAAAVDKLLKVLHDNNMETDESINKAELKEAIEKHAQLSEEELKLMFNGKGTVDDLFTELDKDKNKKVSYRTLIDYLGQKGINLQSRFLGCQRREITNLREFAQCLEDSLLLNSKRMTFEVRDLERSVGINTYYVGTMDFTLEAGDRQLMVEQGSRATKSYLLYYILNRQPCLREDPNRRSYTRDDVRIFVDEDGEIIDANDYAEHLYPKL